MARKTYTHSREVGLGGFLLAVFAMFALYALSIAAFVTIIVVTLRALGVL